MMTLFLGKRLTGCATVGAFLIAGMAVVTPARAADDLPIVGDIEIPMPHLFEDDGSPPVYERPYPERPYSERPYRPGPYAAIPSVRRTRPVDARPMLSPTQVVTILRTRGYSPLGPITQRGWVYTVAALDGNGDDGRLIVDARTGSVMRFIPAMEVDEQLRDRMAMAYGPPPPADVRYVMRRGALMDLRHAPRPSVSVPTPARRPASKTASKPASPVPHGTAPAKQTAAAPAAEKTADNKAAATTVGAAARPSSASAPSTLKLWPTQAMPEVQTLE